MIIGGPGPQQRCPRPVSALPVSGPVADFIYDTATDAAYIANNAGSYQIVDTGSGDVVGPASATDNAIVRYDGTTGKLVQNSGATISDTGTVNIPAGQTYNINGVPVGGGGVGSILTAGRILTTATVGGGLTVYAPLVALNASTLNTASGTEANMQAILPVACTVKNLFFRTTTTQPADGSFVITVRKNGADTALTLTVAANAAAATFSDLVNTVSFAAGDLINLSLVNNSPATNSATYTHWAVLCQ